MTCPDARVPLPLPSQEELLRLRLAVEASGEVVFMTDASGTITYVNPEFVRVYGYAAAEVVGCTTPRILSSGLTPPEEYEAFWAELRTGRVVKREFVNRTKAGALVQIESSANPVVVNGELAGFLAVQRDISDRTATETALRESERRYRALADAAEDSIFIVSRDARIEYANAVSLARFAVRPEDALGRRLEEVFGPQAAGEMWRELSAVFATGQRQYFEARFDAPDGDLWLGTWAVPMSAGAGAPDAVMGVARDITDRKRLEREFAQAQKMEAIGRLAGGIAHDFNNLLTAIIGYSELLLERLRDQPDLAADVAEVRKAGDRASRLTRQLLTFSRKHTLSPQILDLNDVVTELHRMLARIIGEDIRLDIVTAPDLRPVRADPGQLEQIIVNLAVNARDAMPRGGTLHIETANVEIDRKRASRCQARAPGPHVALVVRDSGSGMTTDVLAHAFEPFFTTKPPGKGTGLGLATVYGIAKQSDGCVTIDSAPGEGTVVTTYFPAVGPSGVSRAREAAAAFSGTETILLVEDEPGLLRLMHRTLERFGYAVLPSPTVENALETARRHPGEIHLLVSDVVMPGLNGPDLAQRIVPLRPSMKVLYVSGFASRAAGSAAISANTCFLSKPFTPQVLAAKVRECLDRRPPPPAGDGRG